MKKVQLILVGGFLGAGKTTLLWQAASRLAAQGKRVGLITNDQAPDLVDTGLLSQLGMPVQEVAGSCFCCNFAGLIQAAERLQNDLDADVLIAEPVGSCTDLSATILQPLKDKFRQKFLLAPLSVVVDPLRLRDVLTGAPGKLHQSAAYVVRKQMEEADVIVLNKIDLLFRKEIEEARKLLAEHYPGTQIHAISAFNGEGVTQWLTAILKGGSPGSKIADVDYDTYAEGEAVLGWLNAAIRLTCHGKDANWLKFSVDFLRGLQSAFQERSAAVGHVKVLLSGGQKWCVANLTRTDGEVAVRGDVPGTIKKVDLTVNARVEMSPEDLERLVRNRLNESCREYGFDPEVVHLQSLRPGRPRPTHRYGNVIDN